MRVAHCATVAPNRCGLYGTTRDLISAEVKYGIDAGILNVGTSDKEPLINGLQEGYPKVKDKSVDVKSYEWAKEADVCIRHSYIPVELQNSGKVLLLALHGRPESSFRLEQSRQHAIMTTVQRRAADDRYKGFLVFWKEYMLHWSTLVPAKKLFYVPAPVDLDYYSPKGEKFDFGENAGSPNILIADIWREDVLPFNLIYAALLFQQKYCKTAKIHISALQGNNFKVMSGTLLGIKATGALGTINPITNKINDLYRAADIVITPHTIATRIVRESLACGTPVVAGAGNKYTPYTASPMDTESFAKAINNCWEDYRQSPTEVRAMARKTAEVAFNFDNTGKAMKAVLERVAG